MHYPNNQTGKEERERRLGLVMTWVVQFPRDGRSEKDLDGHIQREFSVNRMTSYTYRRLARERLGAAVAGTEYLAGMLLEWGEQTYDDIERSRASIMDKVKKRTALIGTLAKLAPRNVNHWQAPPDAPPFDPREQLRFLVGEDGSRPAPQPDTNGAPCDP